MVREKTLEKYSKIIDEIKASGLSINKFFKTKSESVTFFKTIANIKKEAESGNEKIVTFLDKYNELVGRSISTKIGEDNIEIEEEIDNNQQSEVANIRNDEGKIIYYKYKIYKRNKRPLEGRLTCEEMNTIYRLYTYYGDNLTARVVSRHFPDFSLPDFKRIIRAFNIYKDSGSFAPHMYEEYTEDELRDIQLREKENSFLRKAEEDNIRNNEKLLRKYANENIELKKQLNTLSNVKVDVEHIEPYIVPICEDDNFSTALNLYLSDVHLGASMEAGSLYKENENYGFNEAKRRLTEIISRLCDLSTNFEVVNLCLLGDNIDCCGVYGKTARLDHDMPENMNPREQFNKFIELYDWFIRSLFENNIIDKKLRVFSVPCGNHSGSYEYALNSTLKYYTEARFPGVEFTLFEQFFGVFEQNDIRFCITHGKDDRFMRKGMPLNLDEKNKVQIYEWLDNNGIHGNNIHIIKGDLHNNNMNSCKRFTYRNVLSLFGSSDYSAYNFTQVSYGLSYDVIVNNNVLSGTIENI